MSPAADTPIEATTRWSSGGVRYSICTMMTRPEQYADMVESFRSKGFTTLDCEFLYLDNSSSNTHDAYSGLNLFLNVAAGDYIVLCHQDIVLIDHGRQRLDQIIAELDELDSTWGLFGNAGGVSIGRLAIRITDPHSPNQHTEKLPIQVHSLDENFIVVRRCANLALSKDLVGFHLYGVDLCIIAELLGWTPYVVDFHLKHLSPGFKDPSFWRIRSTLVNNYSRKFKTRWLSTPNTTLLLTGSPWMAPLKSAPVAHFITVAVKWLSPIKAMLVRRRP